uniref:Transcription termination factor 2 n=1 Tax=Nothoprocta perdicaria TaxID=30464 RepID=A0A8C6Z2E6_NOTPE
MEAVLCAGHGCLCVLKTGVREGPNRGKSFYVCGAQGTAACGFVLPAPYVSRLLFFSTRLFYRCLKSKLNGKKWCGSIPWQDPKATKAPKHVESGLTSVLPFNPSGQRNPFKVIDKNCEPSSWVQVKQGSGEESRAKERKPEKERVMVSDKEKKSSLDSSTESKPPEGLEAKQKQSKGNKNDAELKESLVSESKGSLSETWRAKKVPWDEEKHGDSNRESKKSSEFLEKETGGKSKCFSPNLRNQSTSVERPNEGQLREKNLKSCGDKETKEKECAAGKDQDVKKGGAGVEAAPAHIKMRPELGQASRDDSDEAVLVSSTSDEGKSQKLVLGLQPGEALPGASGMSDQRAALPRAAASLCPEGPQDPKALHNHLVVQLRQKKSTLATVNVQLLPDKGERLLKQVQDLEAALSALNISPGDSTEKAWGSSPIHSRRFRSFLNRTTDKAVNSGVQSLYGGRMTEDRIRAVHNATSDAINHLHKSLESCPTEQTVAEDPPGLKVPLLLHQKQALAWLLWRESQSPCGGILADDMGLGKTLTMIALILVQKKLETGKKKETLEIWLSKNDSTVISSHGTLIVCPASLIHHWKKEIDRHVGYGKLRVYLYHGPNRDKHAEALSEYDVVVTTYSILSKEVPTTKEEGEVPNGSRPCSPLLRVAWARVLLDEAHNIKNPKVQTSIAVCKLRAAARWAVTGTPIQNNLLDMYSLLRFLRCSPFDEYKMWKFQVDNNTRKGGERLSLLTRSLLLRRTKDQLDSAGKPLVSLPQRSTRLHQLKLSAEEQSVYNVLFARSRSTLQSYLKRQEQKNQDREYSGGNPFERVAREFGASQKDLAAGTQGVSQVSSTVHVLSMLLRLRQCCCHLSLLKMALDQANLTSEGLSLSLEEQLSALTLSELQTADSKTTVYLNGTAFKVDLFEITRESTKITHLLAELKTIQSHPESQKSVIVSQWTSMLKVVAVHLQRLGLKYVTVDGSVNPKQRMDVVEEFNNNPKGPQVMLVSLLAGGVGLNLTGGNHLFLLDMHWNPALEDQACDRIYRVGQKRDVVIHRFVCEGTVEEKIVQLQTRKKDLAAQVLSGKGESFSQLTLADLKILFGI